MENYNKFKQSGRVTLSNHEDENRFTVTVRKANEMGEDVVETSEYHLLALKDESTRMQIQIDQLKARKKEMDDLIKDAKQFAKGD